MKELIESKIKDLEVNVISGVVHVDFDDIGNLWNEVFEETFGRRYDDVEGSNEDYDNFDKIQEISYNLLSNYDEMEVKFDNYM
jgi:hypothetical protein